jgi:hypothetical protein
MVTLESTVVTKLTASLDKSGKSLPSVSCLSDTQYPVIILLKVRRWINKTEVNQSYYSAVFNYPEIWLTASR